MNDAQIRPNENRTLDEPAPATGTVGLAQRGTGDDGGGIRSHLNVVLEDWRSIAIVAFLVFVAGVLYVMVTAPVYESEALVQVEERAALKGQGPSDELSGLFELRSTADTEMEILRSRTLLTAVVEDLRLDLRTTPYYFPVIGKAVARWLRPASPVRAPFGQRRFAWGGEQIRVERLRVPPQLEGEKLKLVAGENGSFDLYGPDGDTKLLSGRVGAVAATPAPAQGERPSIELFVSELVARNGTEFLVQKLNSQAVVTGLKEQLRISELGRKTGIIRIALRGTDPSLVTSVLNSIAQRYLRRNVERKSAEAEKTLEFINGQLPHLRANLEAAEEALNKYRAENSRVDVSLETKGILDRLVELEKESTVVQMQFSEAQQRFREGHPVMAAASDKLKRLREERAAIDARLKRLPRAEVESARLMRDVKVANELYILLLNKSQETQIVKSGAVGNVLILDSAVEPMRPVAPQPVRSLGFALIVGLILGVGFAYVRRSFLGRMDDPEFIEREVGLAVYASIPHSHEQSAVARRRGGPSSKGAAKGAAILAVAAGRDPAVEAIRSLRTSVEFALANARNNIVNITGPSPGIGKTFVSVNLAHVLAESGHDVLLVDADLRRGSVASCFGFDHAPGLSEVIQGSTSESDGIRRTGSDRLFVMTRGKVPPNPSELLSSRRFRETIQRASERFDVVIIDTAPVLAVTDAVLAGKTAGTNLVVLRSGHHTMREVVATLKQLAQNGVEPHALVLNDVAQSAAVGSKYYVEYAKGR